MNINRVALARESGGCAACLPVARRKSERAAAPEAHGPGRRGAHRRAEADGEWLSYGRTYDEQRFSPLDRIDAGNVAQLGLAWAFDLDTAHRAQESTPLVIDGVMYVTSAWSKLFALDAKTGKQIWAFDPKVPGEAGVNACCDVVNRGVAAWNGKIYLGTLDGRLVAVDAATGKQAWEVMTVPAGLALHHHRRAARVRRQGAHRQRRRRDRRARLRHRLRRRQRQAAVALLHRARRSRAAVRTRGSREGREDLERRVVEDGRRRHGVGFHRLRPEARSHLHRRRQRQSRGTRSCAAPAAATTSISRPSSR